MNLDEKFLPVRNAFYQSVRNFFMKIAGFFGYPDNPGMPTIADLPSEGYSRSTFLDSLPRHKTFWPPIQRPETWFEMIFGPTPKVEAVPRYIYESKEEGFYNFYIENYKHEEIAEKLNINIKTSWTRLLRAKKLFKESLYALSIEKLGV